MKSIVNYIAFDIFLSVCERKLNSNSCDVSGCKGIVSAESFLITDVIFEMYVCLSTLEVTGLDIRYYTDSTVILLIIRLSWLLTALGYYICLYCNIPSIIAGLSYIKFDTTRKIISALYIQDVSLKVLSKTQSVYFSSIFNKKKKWQKHSKHPVRMLQMSISVGDSASGGSSARCLPKGHKRSHSNQFRPCYVIV